MKGYIRIIQSEFYKLLHSPVILIHLLVPMLGIAVFLGYYHIVQWEEADKVTTYLQVLAMAFPMLIVVVTTLIRENEEMAGFFQGMFHIPSKKSIIHVTKLFLLLIGGLLASFMAVCGFGILFLQNGNREFLASLYIKAAFLLFSGYIPLYMLQYMLSFSLPKGFGLGVGVFGSLLAALLLTGLGDDIWCYLPWSISIRMCSVLVECEVRNWDYMEWTGAQSGINYILISSILLFFTVIIWAEKWEVPAHDSE